MKKKSISALAALAAMMMTVATNKDIYSYEKYKSARLAEEDTEEEKAKRHRMYGGDQAMHNYVINGVTIRATSKKVAKKIYQRMKGNQR